MFLHHLYSGMKEPDLKIIDVFVCKLRKKLIELTGGKDYIGLYGAAAISCSTQQSRPS
jgi:hypothetical protein